MKTYIAEGVLCDWSCGLVVISARGKKHAKKIIDKEFSEESAEEIKAVLVELKAGELAFTYGGG